MEIELASPPVANEEAQHVIAIARSWLGTPYVHQASVKGAGCDCLGLLRGVWRELKGEDAEEPAPYSADWAEATGYETLYKAFRRHMTEIETAQLAPGDVALFRMHVHGPAKHCGIAAEMVMPAVPEAFADQRRVLTLIHARQNRRVAEERFEPFWRARMVAAFRL